MLSPPVMSVIQVFHLYDVEFSLVLSAEIEVTVVRFNIII
jgi:hypothetical protein